MSRPSPCKDPSRWHETVLRWIENWRNRPAITAARFIKAEPSSPNYGLEKWPVSVEYAWSIVGYFYACVKKGLTPDPRAVQFIDDARARYCLDPRRYKDRAASIKRALGLMQKRGNPGRTSAGARNLSEVEFIKAGEQALSRMANGIGEASAVRGVAVDFGISERHVRDSVRDRQAERAVRKVQPRKIVRYVRRGPRSPE